jgi:uncharacterized protein (DUF924 family)
VPVNVRPAEILEFWFADCASDPAKAASRDAIWFETSPRTDALVRERFEPLIEAAGRGELPAWLAEPRSALALVLVLDQFPRNVWRSTPRAFAYDPAALAAARKAVGAGHFERLVPIEQAFLILPFQHSETLDAQREAVRLSVAIEESAPAEWCPLMGHYAAFARQHLALIERFGRFPHRNRVLGRISTAEEQAYLQGGGATFGQG